MLNGGVEGSPELETLKCVKAWSKGRVGKMDGEGDATSVGCGVMKSGGIFGMRGGKTCLGWCIDSEGRVEGAIPV